MWPHVLNHRWCAAMTPPAATAAAFLQTFYITLMFLKTLLCGFGEPEWHSRCSAAVAQLLRGLSYTMRGVLRYTLVVVCGLEATAVVIWCCINKNEWNIVFFFELWLPSNQLASSLAILLWALASTRHFHLENRQIFCIFWNILRYSNQPVWNHLCRIQSHLKPLYSSFFEL